MSNRKASATINIRCVPAVKKLAEARTKQKAANMQHGANLSAHLCELIVSDARANLSARVIKQILDGEK